MKKLIGRLANYQLPAKT